MSRRRRSVEEDENGFVGEVVEEAGDPELAGRKFVIEYDDEDLTADQVNNALKAAVGACPA